MTEFRFKLPEGVLGNPESIDDAGAFFVYDSRTGGATSDGKQLEAGKWYRLKIRKDDNGRFEKTVEEVPPEPEPIGPLFRCPWHGIEQFESGPCLECYDETE